MARIVLADDGIRFDGNSLDAGPLGGVETAVISITEALAARGHEVLVRNNCAAPMRRGGVDWAPIADGLPEDCDLYIANRGDKLIPLMPRARRRAFWIHNPANYLLKWRYLSKLWRFKPTILFCGPFHTTTYPSWAPGGDRVIVPYGISDMFLTAAPASDTPLPRAVFTSNPMRSLDWLLEVWARHIRPACAGAELHVFSGPSTYREAGAAKAVKMTPVLERAAELSDQGVVLRGPVPKAQLVEELRKARVMLYRGDPGEVFCLAAAEAQAVGVPCVVQNIGNLAERVIDGKTGFVADDDALFAERALALLTDDALWRAQSAAAIEKQRRWSWPASAAAMEALIP